MPTFDPRSGLPSFPQAEQYPGHFMQASNGATASSSSDQANIHIRPTPLSIHVIGRHAPPPLQNYIASSRSSPSMSSAAMSGQVIRNRVLEGLREFNSDPDILYISDLRKYSEADRINAEITKQVARIGFSRLSDEEYAYYGDNPAKALRHLLNVRPLVLDCATALHLLVYKGVRPERNI